MSSKSSSDGSSRSMKETILSGISARSYIPTLKSDSSMTDTERSSRRKFLKTAGGVMSVGLATSMAGCSALPGGNGDDNSEITGSITIGDELQGTIEVVTHEDIINGQTDHVGAYVEISNSGESDKSVDILADFFKGGKKVGEDDGLSEMIPTDAKAKLRLGIPGTREDIDEYEITIESAF